MATIASKIKGTREGRPGVWLLSAEEARKCISQLPEDYDRIHNFIGGGALLIGADWDRAAVLEFLGREDIKIALVFEPNVTMKHQLVAINESKRWTWDVGVIEESDMEQMEA